MTKARQDVLADMGSRIAGLHRTHPIRVAIDGVDAAGKTTLADELARVITRLGRPVIRASIDGFHNPQATRRRRGSLSPEGYFHDSFNYPVLVATLLQPLGPGGSGSFRRAVFDFRTNEPVAAEVENAPTDAVHSPTEVSLGWSRFRALAGSVPPRRLRHAAWVALTWLKRRMSIMTVRRASEELLAAPLPDLIRDLGLAVAQANVALKEGQTDIVYTIPEAEIEVKVSLSISRETTGSVSGSLGLQAASVNASYQSTFGFSEEASSSIRLIVRAVTKTAAADTE